MKNKINKLGIFFLVSLFLCIFQAQAFGEGPKVINVVGEAEIHRPSKRRILRISRKREISRASERRLPVSVGEELRPGDRIQVVGKGVVVIQKGKAAIESLVTDNSKLNYLGKSFLTGVERFAVPKGRVRFKIKKGYNLDVKTPHMVASVRGTEFTALVETDISTISVVSGEVLVSDYEGHGALLTGGESISATMDGLPTADDRVQTGDDSGGDDGSGDDDSGGGEDGNDQGEDGNDQGEDGDDQGEDR